MGAHCRTGHDGQPATVIHEGERPTQPVIINWESYINDLAFVTPIRNQTRFIKPMQLDMVVVRDPSQSQAASEISIDDLLSEQNLNIKDKLNQRPMSPQCPVVPNVFRPFGNIIKQPGQ